MSNKLFENLLNAFNKANKDRKLKLAKDAGYDNPDEYKKYLQVQLGDVSFLNESPKVKPTIHIVDIVDCSGSMSGHKLFNAEKGINDGIERLKKETDVNYLYTLCTFNNFAEHPIVAVSIDQVLRQNLRATGITALQDAIGFTIDKLMELKDKDDKVLINIYTDGQENASKTYNSYTIASLIDQVKKQGVTVTFIGTVNDTEDVINRFSIDRSNTLAYDGSARGLELSLQATSDARSVFSKKVINNEDVAIGFYKTMKQK